MAIETTVVLDRIEVMVETSALQVRFKKMLLNNGEVMAFEYHRTTIAPDTDVAEQFAAVNDDLNRMGFPAVSSEDIARVQNFAELARSSE